MAKIQTENDKLLKQAGTAVAKDQEEEEEGLFKQFKIHEPPTPSKPLEPYSDRYTLMSQVELSLEERDLQAQMRNTINSNRKQMHNRQAGMVLRTMICLKDIGLFSSTEHTKNLYGNQYSGNHVAIFECQLKHPPQMAWIDHTMDEFFDAYRINFKNWRIVDIDNFMGGNPFFSQIKEESVWEREVQAICGNENSASNYVTDTGPEHAVGLKVTPSNRKLFDSAMRAHAHGLQEIDTRSNRMMSPLHKRREDMALKRDDLGKWEEHQAATKLQKTAIDNLKTKSALEVAAEMNYRGATFH